MAQSIAEEPPRTSAFPSASLCVYLIRQMISDQLFATLLKLQIILTMASPIKLSGTDLVDCARANAKEGIEVAAYQCGFGTDLNTFSQELRKACEQMNLHVKELSALITDQDMILQLGTGEIVAPDTPSEL